MRLLAPVFLVVAGAAAAQGLPASAAPLGARTPVPELPGMGRPVDTATVAARRRALLTRIGRVLPTDSLDRVLRAALFRVPGPVYVPLDRTTRDEQRLADLAFEGRDVRNARPIADSLRLVKDANNLGVRIEHDVLVTSAGAELLSAKAPRMTGDIERLMRGGP